MLVTGVEGLLGAGLHQGVDQGSSPFAPVILAKELGFGGGGNDRIISSFSKKVLLL